MSTSVQFLLGFKFDGTHSAVKFVYQTTMSMQ